MALDYDKIRRTLRQHLLKQVELTPELGDNPETRINWENQKFSPPNPPDFWMREAFLPGDERLVATNLLQGVGIYQMDLFGPENVVAAQYDALAKRIMDKFPAGHSIQGLVNMAIDKCTRTPGSNERSSNVSGQNYPWYTVKIRVEWRTYGANLY